MLGLRCYPSLLDIDQPLELVVISLPAKYVQGIILEASQRGDVWGAVILSAGFSETAIPENVALEEEIVNQAAKAGIRIVGPNCIGLINAHNRLCTGFAPGLKIRKGGIGFITQSGAFGASFLMLAGDQPQVLGFSKFAHVGNMADVSNIELLEYLGEDPDTNVLGMYIEGVRDGRGFLNAARQITRRKPIFVLKVGITDAGSSATFSHTGTLAGSDRVYEAAFKQAGIVRVAGLDELLDACKGASMLPRPKGRRICVLTEAGGPGIIAMDELDRDPYLQQAQLDAHTKHQLEVLLPPMAMICKPDGYIDMTAAALEREHAEALRLILKDPAVDSVLLISVPPTFLPAMDLAGEIADVIKAYDKPVAVCLMRGEVMASARGYLESRQIPTFDTPEAAVRALADFTKAVEYMQRNV
ncbi:MAG: CoA-binding protein [Anaerolineaceae bacterium]|nr:CoA-binding protein [Anaerolineaceae bacterium]